MELRNSEIPVVQLSPAQLLFRQTIRTFVPTTKSSLHPMGYNSELVLQELQNIKGTLKPHYDRYATPLKALGNGDIVRVRTPGQFIKNHRKVVRPAKTLRSYYVKRGNTTVRRNYRDLIKSKEQKTEQPIDTDEIAHNDDPHSANCHVSNS